jgi:hypothetical protein
MAGSQRRGSALELRRGVVYGARSLRTVSRFVYSDGDFSPIAVRGIYQPNEPGVPVNVSAYVLMGNVRFEAALPTGRPYQIIDITPDYPYYLEV